MTATILVVDDTQQNIELLEARLLSEYYGVLTATSGKQALEILAAKNGFVRKGNKKGMEVCREYHIIFWNR